MNTNIEKSNHSHARVVISLGSNSGDRLQNLMAGSSMWKNADGIDLLQISRVYESEPAGEGVFTGKFYNACIVCDCRLSPMELLSLCKGIERKACRQYSDDTNRDRTLDCDIIFYGDSIVDSIDLQIPHRNWADRPFVLKPLEDLHENLIEWQRRECKRAMEAFTGDLNGCAIIDNMLI